MYSEYVFSYSNHYREVVGQYLPSIHHVRSNEQRIRWYKVQSTFVRSNRSSETPKRLFARCKHVRFGIVSNVLRL